jgi:hypothetical protein
VRRDALRRPVLVALRRVRHLVGLDVDVHARGVRAQVGGVARAEGRAERDDVVGLIMEGEFSLDVVVARTYPARGPPGGDHDLGHVHACGPLLLAADLARVERGEHGVAVELGDDEREGDMVWLCAVAGGIG